MRQKALLTVTMVSSVGVGLVLGGIAALSLHFSVAIEQNRA
jgi:hypothetical protein